MPRNVQFHLDENCDPRIAAGLRLHGVSVTTTPEADLLQANDKEQLAYCVAQARVIVTQDPDFIRLSTMGEQTAGIVFYSAHSRSIGQIIRHLLLIWELYESEEMHNQIEFL